MKSFGRGFTLIELLVVIAIVAILAAILFPVIAAAKARGNQAMCANNMRQTTTAMISYADDWQGWLPGLYVFGDLVDVNKQINKGVLWQYVKSKDVFCCPVEVEHRKAGSYPFTYTMNGYMTYAETERTKANSVGVPVTKSRNPTRTILLVDENTDPNKNQYSVNDALFINLDATCDRHPQAGTRRIGISTGSANVCYLDTHIGVVPGLLVWNIDKRDPQSIFYR